MATNSNRDGTSLSTDEVQAAAAFAVTLWTSDGDGPATDGSAGSDVAYEWDGGTIGSSRRPVAPRST